MIWRFPNGYQADDGKAKLDWTDAAVNGRRVVRVLTYLMERAVHDRRFYIIGCEWNPNCRKEYDRL